MLDILLVFYITHVHGLGSTVLGWWVDCVDVGGHEAVDEFFADDLLDDILFIIISERSRQLIIIHMRFRFPFSPLLRHRFCIDQSKLSIGASRPFDDVSVSFLLQEF